MRFDLAEDERMLRDMVREFTSNEVPQGTSATLWPAIVELGLTGITAPESAEGIGLDAVALAVVLEELAVGSGALATRLAAHAGAATTALAAVGEAEAHTLKGIATGERTAAWIPGGLITLEGGTLRGQVALVPNADRADIFVIAVEGAEPTIAVLRRSDLRYQATEAPLGLTDAGFGEVEVSVHASACSTYPVAADVLAACEGASAIADAAVAVGISRAAIAAAVPYALERKQFGKPIARFQAVQWMIADSATELDAARLMVWHAAAGEVAPAHARLMAGTVARRITDHAIQIHGGYGYTAEYPVAAYWRDAHHCLTVAGPDGGRRAIAAAVVEAARA
jgi:alkylation response protein AidB-like acyl-CoA dehydrogenase